MTMLNANKIEQLGNQSQAAINNGSGNVTQVINNINYGLAPGASDDAMRQPNSSDPENRQRVRLDELVGPSMPTVHGRHFVDMDILGPCIIYPIDEVEIISCNWYAITQALFITIPDEWEGVSGAIGLSHCSFRGCNFKNIAIMAKTVQIEQFKKGITERDSSNL